MEAVLLKKWEVLATRYDELTNQLMDPSMMSQPSQLHKVNKERTDIEPAAKLLGTYRDNAEADGGSRANSCRSHGRGRVA